MGQTEKVRAREGEKWNPFSINLGKPSWKSPPPSLLLVPLSGGMGVIRTHRASAIPLGRSGTTSKSSLLFKLLLQIGDE